MSQTEWCQYFSLFDSHTYVADYAARIIVDSGSLKVHFGCFTGGKTVKGLIGGK